MTALARVKLPFFKDFGNAKSTGGLPYTHANNIGAHAAMTAAIVIVLVELALITWIRHRYMDTPPLSGGPSAGGVVRRRART